MRFWHASMPAAMAAWLLSGAAPAVQASDAPDSLEDLFELDKGDDKSGSGEALPEHSGWNPRFQGYFGFLENKTAYTVASPSHWSLSRNLLEAGVRGTFMPGVKWLLSGRIGYDPVYATTNFYPSAVRHDQTFEMMFRETYLDASLGDWDFRIGRQHIIWGEMVGLFFADVVSAKDLRQFVVQNLDTLRTPQWAIRGEYFKDSFHGEVVWIPVMTYDNIGKVGAEFFPFNPPAVPGFQTTVLNDRHPSKSIDNSAYGARLSCLWSGFDISGFYYSSPDNVPAFGRSITLGAAPSITYSPVHKRLQKWGLTLSKDLTDTLMFKGEAVYTQDRPFLVTSADDPDGLKKQDFFDYVLGLNFTFADETRLNLQFFQSIFTRHASDNPLPEVATGYSLLLSTRWFHPKVEPQITFLQFVNNPNWMLNVRTTWEFATNWRVAAGADVFGGPRDSLFGQYQQKDRIYTELRYSF